MTNNELVQQLWNDLEMNVKQASGLGINLESINIRKAEVRIAGQLDTRLLVRGKMSFRFDATVY